MVGKRNGEYWRRAYECPFYVTSRIDILECEAGLIHFETKDGIRFFIDNACELNYRDCPIYKAKMKDYEVKEREELEEKRRNAANRNR